MKNISQGPNFSVFLSPTNNTLFTRRWCQILFLKKHQPVEQKVAVLLIKVPNTFQRILKTFSRVVLKRMGCRLRFIIILYCAYTLKLTLKWIFVGYPAEHLEPCIEETLWERQSKPLSPLLWPQPPTFLISYKKTKLLSVYHKMKKTRISHFKDATLVSTHHSPHESLHFYYLLKKMAYMEKLVNLNRYIYGGKQQHQPQKV